MFSSPLPRFFSPAFYFLRRSWASRTLARQWLQTCLVQCAEGFWNTTRWWLDSEACTSLDWECMPAPLRRLSGNAAPQRLLREALAKFPCAKSPLPASFGGMDTQFMELAI